MARTRKLKHIVYEFLLRARLLLPLFVLLIALLVWLAATERYTYLAPQYCRLFGYPALALILIPYAYVLRRFWLRRYLGNMTGWVVYHIYASYGALALVLIHSQGRADQSLTFWLMCLFWTVMISGVGGLFGQRLCYRVLPFFVQHELGMERLEPERRWLFDLACELAENTWLLVVDDIRDWENFCDRLSEMTSDQLVDIRRELWKLIPGSACEMIRAAADANFVDEDTRIRIVRSLNTILRDGGRFYRTQQLGKLAPEMLSEEVQHLLKVKKLSDEQRQRLGRLVMEIMFDAHIARSLPERPDVVKRYAKEVTKFLQKPLPSLWQQLTVRTSRILHANYYQNVMQRVEPDQQGVVRAFWKMVQKRRAINREYRVHRLAKLWLWVHGPAAWALLILVLAHVVSSIYYGGF